MFEDQRNEQLRKLIQSPQWKAFEDLELSLRGKLRGKRISAVGKTLDQIAINTLEIEGKIEGMRYLLEEAYRLAREQSN